MKIRSGWVDGVKKCLSPNFNSRPASEVVSLLVIHNISLPPREFGGDYIECFFQNCLPTDAHPYFKTIEGLEVSSHFLIKRNGELIQFVSCDDRAWHAGQSCFEGKDNCNDYSIGIELEGADDLAYEPAQYLTLVALTQAIRSAYPDIVPDRITGHEHIAPNRKTDPGPAFDWTSYKAAL